MRVWLPFCQVLKGVCRLLGAEGSVSQVRLTADLRVVIQKSPHDAGGVLALKQIVREAGVLSILQHENIVQLVGLCTFPENL